MAMILLLLNLRFISIFSVFCHMFYMYVHTFILTGYLRSLLTSPLSTLIVFGHWKLQITLTIDEESKICSMFDIQHTTLLLCKTDGFPKHVDRISMILPISYHNPLPHRDASLHFCKQSRHRSGSSRKNCLISVFSVCIWTYN